MGFEDKINAAKTNRPLTHDEEMAKKYQAELARKANIARAAQDIHSETWALVSKVLSALDPATANHQIRKEPTIRTLEPAPNEHTGIFKGVKNIFGPPGPPNTPAWDMRADLITVSTVQNSDTTHYNHLYLGANSYLYGVQHQRKENGIFLPVFAYRPNFKLHEPQHYDQVQQGLANLAVEYALDV